METTDGVPIMTPEMRQTPLETSPLRREKKCHSEVKRRGQFCAHFPDTKKKPQKREPQQLGLTPLGPFSGPENGPHCGAAAETRSRSAAVARTLETRRPLATEMQYATCLGTNTASHHIRVRPTASFRSHLLCCRLLPLTPSSCQRQREKDTETHE